MSFYKRIKLLVLALLITAGVVGFIFLLPLITSLLLVIFVGALIYIIALSILHEIEQDKSD